MDKHESDDLAALRARIDELDERDRRLVELLQCGSPDRIEHRLRNLIHELQLIRTLVKQEVSDEH